MPIPLPKGLSRAQTVIKKQYKAENEKDKVLREIKRGLLKKRNEYYMQQTRTFILTNEPKLRYYKSDSEYRVSDN